MRKIFVLFAILANLLFVLACSQEQPSKEQLIGTWKHPISVGSINVNKQKVQLFTIMKFLNLKGTVLLSLVNMGNLHYMRLKGDGN